MSTRTQTAEKTTVIDPRAVESIYKYADEKQQHLHEKFSSNTLLGNSKFTAHFILWVTFWRRNLHRFATDYLGLSLKLYQVIMLYLMGINNTFVCIASRASAKSFIVAVYACCKAILYPQSSIVLCASTKRQAKLLVSEKIEKELCSWSPVLKTEIKNIVANNNDTEVTFKNGSKIIVVPASENARGYRATDIVREECRLIPKIIDDSILSPFKFVRPTPYLSDPFYLNIEVLKEDATDIYISSSYFDDGSDETWMWSIVDQAFDDMLNDKPACLLAFDETVALAFGIKKREDLLKEKKKQDRLTWLLEFKNYRLKENRAAFFSYQMLQQNQNNKKVFYPRLTADYLAGRKNPYAIPKQKNEVRVVACDLAFVTGDANDNSIYSCLRLLPESTTYNRESGDEVQVSNGYRRIVPYLESKQGGEARKQAIRIRQLFEDFEADYIVLDTRNAGRSVYEAMARTLFDEERDVEYAPLACMNKKELAESIIVEGAEERIYAIEGNQRLNSDIAQDFRSILVQKRIEFLVPLEKALEDILPRIKEYQTAPDGDTLNFYEAPFLETQAMFSETAGLLYEKKKETGIIVVHEQGANRKDRYSSVSYGSWFATLLEKDLGTQSEEYEFAIFVN